MSLNRRAFLAAASGLGACGAPEGESPPRRPNILLAISDDQSFPHVSIAGDPLFSGFEQATKEDPEERFLDAGEMRLAVSKAAESAHPPASTRWSATLSSSSMAFCRRSALIQATWR